MKILNAKSIREADEYTINNEPISALDLMERAAQRWLEKARPFLSSFKSISVCAGKGNNGGDGLAIARFLLAEDFKVNVFHFSENDHFSPDCEKNQERLISNWASNYHYINTLQKISATQFDELVIDALFGTGLKQDLTGFYASVVHHINNSEKYVLAVDLPSGLFSDKINDEQNAIIRAKQTISFQVPKISFFFPENEIFLGEISIANIDLNQDFLSNAEELGKLVEKNDIFHLLKPRPKFSHKGSFDHAHIIAGSPGMVGAAVLCSKACIHSGAGLVSAHLPPDGVLAMQCNCPEVMTKPWISENEFSPNGLYAIGPGLGTNEISLQKLKTILNIAKKPVVIDADGINLLSTNPKLLGLLPKNSILTPHPKELERLIGKTKNSLEQLEKTQAFANNWELVLLIKRANTVIISPNNVPYFNSTGNPGMATAGSGDVLTGIITGFLAQGYPSFEAAQLGVYFHGMAGDIAKLKMGELALSASTIIENLGLAFKQFDV